MLRTDSKNFIDMKSIMGESIVLSDSIVGILYFRQSIHVLNTHFYFGQLISFEPVDQ